MRKTERAVHYAQNLDCAFFLENPSRTYRIRAALPGETNHVEHNTVVGMFLSFDGQHAEVAYREARFASFPGDDERFAAWAWDRLTTLFHMGVVGVIDIGAHEIEAARNRFASTALPGLGALPACPDRISAMVTFAAYPEQRRAR